MKKIFIDLETSSLHAGPSKKYFGEILEIGICIEEGNHYSELAFRFIPMKMTKHDPKAIEINNYHKNMKHFNNLLLWEETAEDLHELLNQKCLLIGHNVLFDINYLNYWFNWFGLKKLSFRYIDTMTLIHEHLEPVGLKSLSLDAARKFLKMSLSNSHTGLQDARDTREIYNRLLRCSKIDRQLLRFGRTR